MDDSLAAAARYESGQSLEPLKELERRVAGANDVPTRRRVEASLVRLLAPETTCEAKRFACRQLAIVGGELSVNALARLLEDAETVGIACYALVGNRSSDASTALRDALAGTAGSARAQVAAALGARHDADAVAELTELTHGEDLLVAEAAVRSLGKIGAEGALRAVEAATQSPHSRISSAGYEAMLRTAEREAAEGERRRASRICRALIASEAPLQIRRGALECFFAIRRGGGQQLALNLLASEDDALKPVAIARVAVFSGPETSARFAALLPDLAPLHRVWMIQALADRRDSSIVPAFREQLADRDPAVRAAAIIALGRTADGNAVPALARALARARTEIERRLVEAVLIRLEGGEATDRAIVAQLRRRTLEPKQYLVSALAHRGGPEATRILLLEAGSRDPAVTKAAFMGLSRLADTDDLGELLDLLIALKTATVRSEAEEAVARALARVEEPSTRSAAVIARLTETEDAAGRRSLIRLLPICGDAPALAAVDAAAQDVDASVRDAAVRALTDWPNPAAWPSLVRLYRSGTDDLYHVLALRGLARLAGGMNATPSEELIARYHELLRDARSDGDRRLILGALADCHHPDALRLAVGQLDNEAVRAEAAAAVRKIAAAIEGHHPEAARDALGRLR